MPLPCSPVSHSETNSPSDDSDSDDSLTTPRPGPADPALRSAASLSITPLATRGKESAPRGIEGRDFVGENRDFERRKSSLSFSPQSHPPRPMATSSYAPAEPIPEDSMSPQSMSPKGGARRSEGHDDMAESSADESTAIIRAGRTTSRANHYGATNANGEQNGYDGAAEEPRQRKNGSTGKARSGNTVTRGRRGNDEEHEDEHESWYKGLVEKYGSIELENKGSVARDHLALERTFLAWLRTSLSFASIGIAITQLFRLNTTIASQTPDESVDVLAASAKLRSVGKPLGATFLGISILILLLGFHRYFESQHYVIRGKFPASRGTILIVSAVAAALIIASLVVVIAVAPQAFET